VPDLLVVGDANPDLVLRGGSVEPAFGQREQLVERAELVLGGSGAIVACGAARLGLEVAMYARVGDDSLGELTMRRLRAAGVDVAPVEVVAGETTGISVGLVRGDDRAVLTAPGALAALDPDALPDELLRGSRHVHVASPFLQPRLAAGAGRLVARARAAGATTSLDTGWDPAERWALPAEALRADILFPNAEEAVRLAAAADPRAEAGEPRGGAGEPRGAAGGRRGAAGGPRAAAGANPRAAARALAAAGAIVALKLGAAGAVAYAGGEAAEVAPPAVDFVDATGAGDSFDAGFVAARLAGEPLAAALALAVACGALSTRAAGGTAAQPTLEEARALT
jgi:sugar/nucleoside kinase (ribokinase family)